MVKYFLFIAFNFPDLFKAQLFEHTINPGIKQLDLYDLAERIFVKIPCNGKMWWLIIKGGFMSVSFPPLVIRSKPGLRSNQRKRRFFYDYA